MNIVRIYELFPTEADCLAHLESVRWHGTPVCPYCLATSSTPLPKESRHHCNACKTTFSVTVRTIFHHTHLPLQKWFLAISLILNAKKGLSSLQLSRDLQVNKNTAWRIGMQVRKAMGEGEQRELLVGVVEVDETYIGGKPRKGNSGSREQDGGDKSTRGRGTKKTPVVGLIERGGNVRTKVVKKDDLTAKKLSALVRQHVDIANSTLFTDEYAGYAGIKKFMEHRTVNHSVCYVGEDGTHTNSIESFWAIVKRAIVGQYHHVTVRYLPRYLVEISYRLNHRETANLFSLTIQRAIGVAS
jgi:transposase-like protein